VSSPSGVRGRAPAENGFDAFLVHEVVNAYTFSLMADMRHLAEERGLWRHLGPSKTEGHTLQPQLP